MGSSDPSRPRAGTRWLRGKLTLLVWLPILVIGAMHYAARPDPAWVHDVLRRLYYLPIVVAAFQAGLRASMTAAFLVTLTYLPHAFGLSGQPGHHLHHDPGDTVHKALEIVLYHVVAIVAGYLADLESRRRHELEHALLERQRLERQLIRAGRLGAMGELVAGIAHEIKNPLHVLRGTAEVVGPLVPSDSAERRMWELHVSELERLGRVADRFLSFASPTPANMESIDLRGVARRLVELLGPDARQRRIELTLDLPESDVMVTADRDQMAQVGLNIAANATRAIGDRGGKIIVTVRLLDKGNVPLASDRACLLRIENDGPRIAEQDREHLFDPFHGSSEGGTGLGLSIAARIVEQHGGSIEVDDQGLGVGFTVFLPAANRSDNTETR
jgi:two-component system, NtrC family, sensor histidine kinase HydH